jgi:hypothetical protein
MNATEALERRYRRLLAWYPAEHRRVHGEEMIGVLLAAASGGQRRPRLADTLDLIKGGMRIRLAPRRYDGLDVGWSDTLSVASVAIPTMIAIVYAAIFGWSLYNRIGVVGHLPGAPTAVLTSFLLLIALPPVLALRGLRRIAMLLYFVPVLFLGYFGGGPVVSGGDGAFFLAFLIAAVAFVLSPGARRAAKIMSARAWAAVCGIGLALCVPEVLVRLSLLQRPIPVDRSFVWLGANRETPVMITTMALIAVGGAIALVRTLPSPVGKRLLTLLAAPAYPGMVTLATGGSGTIGPLGAFEAVYLPTVLLACLAAVQIWRSRHGDRAHGTPGPPGRHS